MSDEAPPILPDEPILRRIAKSPGYYDPKKEPPVERGAFTPNRSDTDGLSLYLEREISPARLVAAANKPADRFLVARLKASDIYGLGFSLTLDTRPGELPGHVLVKEINYDDYKDRSRNAKIKDAIVSLSESAGKNIVFGL